ncbi:MAG: PTS sugar transporter subunit IIC [Elusimicrobiaceae bacterium]|nr:PTS sugar transporter subunit IIC [Elusimicrobiaceae bacterium]
MTLTAFILCIVASVLELDITYAFQLLISRPIIAGPIFGLITGDVMAGVQVGIFAELLFSDVSPLGGIIPPNGIVATVLPLILYHQGVALYFGFFVGVLAAILYSLLDTYLRKARSPWLVFLEKEVDRKPTVINRIIFGALLQSFLMAFVFISVAAWISSQLMLWLTPYLTYKLHVAFLLAYTAVPWIGLAALLPAFRLKAR